jgi:hypothetical protein
MQRDAPSDKKAVYEQIKRIVTNVRNDESAGIVMPLAYDRNGNKMYDLTLLSASGGTQTAEVGQTVDRYARQMAMALLADFILLGHEKVGSFALSREKTLVFSVALGAWCDAVCDVINRHLIPKLVRMNGWIPTAFPKLVHGKVSPISLQDAADLISKMAKVPGYVLYQAPEVEQYLLERAGIPVPASVPGDGKQNPADPGGAQVPNPQNPPVPSATKTGPDSPPLSA